MKSEKIKQQLDRNLLDIDRLLVKGKVDEAFKKYIELIKKIEREDYKIENSLKANVYISFAYFLFGVSEYESFFKMLIKAQDYGYSRDEIEKLLWQAFIEPNLNEFKTIYEANADFLQSNGYIEKTVSFQELPYWLLPTGVANEYYMYDKEQKLIKEKISLYKYQENQFLPELDTFADYLLLDSWSLDNILSYTNAIKELKKKTYIVLDNIDKFLSCLQGALLSEEIISNVLIFDNLNSVKKYFKRCNAYLPRNIVNMINNSKDAVNIIDEIHKYRISEGNGKRDNILLSICIPSLNRGKRAYDNVIHCLQTYYDEEIEIVLSNNGTQNETKEYYEKIKEINDSRLVYFAFEENQMLPGNICKLSELASGKFILLLSDEDLVNFNVLDKIMNMLSKSKETLSIMRTPTSHAAPPPNEIVSAGKNALFTFMLTSNYMSGIIYNNEMIKKYRGVEYIRENRKNNVTLNVYAHVFLELLLCQYGNVQGTDLRLVYEGEPEKLMSDLDYIPHIFTLEGRLEQHEGFLNIFKDLEICQNDFDIFREMYMRLCYKTIYLVQISINVFYKKTDVNGKELIDKAYEYCIKLFKHIFGKHSSYSRDEMIIKQYCKNIKESLS